MKNFPIMAALVMIVMLCALGCYYDPGESKRKEREIETLRSQIEGLRAEVQGVTQTRKQEQEGSQQALRDRDAEIERLRSKMIASEGSTKSSERSAKSSEQQPAVPYSQSLLVYMDVAFAPLDHEGLRSSEVGVFMQSCMQEKAPWKPVADACLSLAQRLLNVSKEREKFAQEYENAKDRTPTGLTPGRGLKTAKRAYPYSYYYGYSYYDYQQAEAKRMADEEKQERDQTRKKEQSVSAATKRWTDYVTINRPQCERALQDIRKKEAAFLSSSANAEAR